MNLGDKIALSKDRWERKPADHYPTPAEATEALLSYLFLLGSLRVREPCCGQGHISKVLEAHGHRVTSSDLHDMGYGETGIDYLKTREKSARFYDFDAVITNPPFSLAEQFIRRALRDAPLVAMFLPNNYWHAEGRRRLFESRPPMVVLALTWRPAFLEKERGKSPLSNFVWTVWNDAHPGPTQYKLLAKPC
jgi:predicted RNA methylase